MLKWLGSLIVWCSLGVGTLAAVTAYYPTLTAVADCQPALSLNGPAGRDPGDPSEPLFEPSTETPVVLSPDVVQQLREAGVQRVRVKEFSFARWGTKYWFGFSAVGLIVGAILIRADIRQRLNEQMEAPAGERASADELIRAAADECRRLIEETATGDDRGEARQASIVATLEKVRKRFFDPFADLAPALTQKLGIAGYAQLMDQFAAAERLLNRSWSAAVDRQMDESLDCLRQGSQRLDALAGRL